MSSTINSFSVIKAIINSIVRISPVALYTGTAVSGLVFDDFRATILLFGFVIIEALSYGYRLILQGIYNPQCALMKTETDYFVLPSPITQTISFFAGFLFSEMYAKGVFNPGKTFGLVTIIVITIFSRINVGCETFLDSLFCTSIGLLLGVFYFTVIKDYYRSDFFRAEKSKTSEDKKGGFFSFDNA